MTAWQIWGAVGILFILLEFVVPGGIIVFLGMAALFVGALVYYGVITTITMSLIAWFMSSLFLMLFLRSVFIKYFEGDSNIENVDEDEHILGSIVQVIEEVFPYKEGRVRFRDSTWAARSEEEFKVGSSAVISGRQGNCLIIKSIMD
jgi:membrane protein implicated in regulation of membrane protease activity